MTKVKRSNDSYLHVPESLSKRLDLMEEDEVEVVRLGHLVALWKPRRMAPPGSLRELAGLVTSSRPKGSVDVSETMNQKGYEGLHG